MLPPLLNKAYLLAQQNPYAVRAKLSAILADRRAVLSVGFNSNKTHPRMKPSWGEFPNCLHAEGDAIFSADRRGINTIGTTLYIARAKRPNNTAKIYVIGLARPCKRCMEIICSSGIKEIIYTTDNGFNFERIM